MLEHQSHHQQLWTMLQSRATGEVLPVEKALIAEGVKPHHAALCMDRVERYGGNVADVIEDFGIALPEVVARAIARSLGLAYFEPSDIDLILSADWPEKIRDKAEPEMIPVAYQDGKVMVAISSQHQRVQATNTYYPIEAIPVIASKQTIQTAYRKLFARTLDILLEKCARDPESPGYHRDILEALIRHACYVGASDIHLSPSGNSGLIRVRHDGSLHAITALPIATYNRLLGIIKNEGRINDLTTTAEASLPAPGELESRYHLRVQVSRSVRGDTAVLRILDQQGSLAEFETLGYDDDTAQSLRDFIHTSAGLVLITGPTGSGKTTTLYAMLRMLDPLEISIQSVENPVEYQCGVWNQYEIRRGSGHDEGQEWLGWFKGLLRNDLDVALLGEVRDRETAKAAIEMANTGHLVLTTLHTNSATRAITRLSMMGLDMPALSDVIVGITAQRLVRRLCPICRVPDERPDTLAELEQYGHDANTPVYRANEEGCPECGHTGYRGRRMVYELLKVDEQVRHLIATSASGADLLSKIPPERRMWGHGVKLVAEGVTSMDELKRRVIKE